MPLPPRQINYLIVTLFASTIGFGVLANEPSALIENIKGGGSLNVMDYVEPGRTIDLGADGRIVLSYIESCRTETIVGGVVKVGKFASQVQDGQLTVSEAACQSSGVVLAKNTQDAAGTVYRVQAFAEGEWDERTIKGDRPLFQWRGMDGGAASVAVYYMDEEPAREIWRGESDKNSLAYPDDAPALEIGAPYEARLTLPDGERLVVTFSIDPGLEGPDSLLSRLVPIRAAPGGKN